MFKINFCLTFDNRAFINSKDSKHFVCCFLDCNDLLMRQLTQPRFYRDEKRDVRLENQDLKHL